MDNSVEIFVERYSQTAFLQHWAWLIRLATHGAVWLILNFFTLSDLFRCVLIDEDKKAQRTDILFFEASERLANWSVLRRAGRRTHSLRVWSDGGQLRRSWRGWCRRAKQGSASTDRPPGLGPRRRALARRQRTPAATRRTRAAH